MSTKAQAPNPESLAEEVSRLRAERATKLADPAAVSAIDAQIRELEGRRQALEEEAALAQVETKDG